MKLDIALPDVCGMLGTDLGEACLEAGVFVAENAGSRFVSANRRSMDAGLGCEGSVLALELGDFGTEGFLDRIAWLDIAAAAPQGGHWGHAQ